MRPTFALCLATLLSLAAPDAYGFCVEHPTNPTTQAPFTKVAWSGMPITFRLHDTGSGTMDQAAERDGVRAAFAEWAAAACTTLSFAEGDLIPASEMINLQHNAREIRVYWARTQAEWDSDNTAPIAKTWYNFDVSGNIVSGAVLLNAVNKQYSTAAEASKYDVQSVMATEVGRVLGLAASTNNAAVMYPSFAVASVDKRTLKADDLAAIAYLYPAATGGCGTATPDAACPSGVAAQQDGGAPAADGGTHPGADSGSAPGADGGDFHCTANAQCESGTCRIDGTCLPAATSSGGGGGCSAAGRTDLTAGLLLLAVALGLVLRRRH
ncbi:MAG TPA: matrixin family metalloprotease [Polyangia bacterium]